MASPALPSSAFESGADFPFNEAAGEEFRDMQQSISSLNVLPEGQASFHTGMGAVHGHDSMSGLNNQYHPNYVNPFMFEQGNMSPHGTSWPNARSSMEITTPSMQAEIANERSVSVSHQFGQITPPDDHIPARGFTTVQQQFKKASQPGEAALSAKSERARNAANQRHAKAKKARKDGSNNGNSADLKDDDVDEGRRERYREKNRLAAAKCRAKKKVNTEDLEETARMASARNNKLRAEERELRDLFSSLRNQALAHDPSQGCPCGAIHSYNLHKAQDAARGAMGWNGLMTASPMQRSVDSGSPSSLEATSRAQSFSGVRPRFAKHQARSRSLVNQIGDIASNEGNMLEALSASSDLDHSNFDFTQNQTGFPGDDFSEYVQRSPNGQQMYQS